MSLSNNLPCISKEECTYTPFYCEENIWWLAQHDKFISREKSSVANTNFQIFVIFISNDKECTPIWQQKALKYQSDQPVLWDYHVILLVKEVNQQSCTNSAIYDFDSLLPFPTMATRYIEETFHPDDLILEEYRQMFRVVKAKQFVRMFASDRSHMLTSTGEWLQPPPNYQPIKSEFCDELTNLHRYRDMNAEIQGNDFGDVLNLSQFSEFVKQ